MSMSFIIKKVLTCLPLSSTAADLFMGVSSHFCCKGKAPTFVAVRRSGFTMPCHTMPYHATHNIVYHSVPYHAVPYHTAVSPSLSIGECLPSHPHPIPSTNTHDSAPCRCPFPFGELGPPALVRQGVLWHGHASYVHSAREINGSIIQPAILPHMWSQVPSLSGLGLWTILAHLGLKGSRFSGPGRVFRILPDLSVAELPWRGSCPWTDTGDSAGNQRLGLICLHFSVLRNQGQTTFTSARHRNPKVPLAIEFACFAIFILGYKMLQGWTYFKIIYI